MNAPAWKVKAKFKAVKDPPPPPPPLLPHRALGGTYGSNKTWMISFSDIMALMLTFFIMLYAMSEHGIPKEAVNGGVVGQQTQTFDGGVGYLGDSDTITLSRTAYKKGLDIGYLSQIIEAKKIAIPELNALSLVRDGETVLLTLPLSVVGVKDGRMIRSESVDQVLQNIANILEAVPNDIDLHVEWRARDGFSDSTAGVLSIAREIRAILTTQNPRKNMKILIPTRGADDAAGEPRIMWRIVPLKPRLP